MKTRRRRKQSVVPVEDGQQEFEQGRTLAVSQSSSRRSSIHSLQKIHPHSGKLSRTNSNHNVYAEANGAHNQQTNPLLSNVKDGKISMIDWFSTEDEEPISDIMSAQQSAPLQPLLTELPIQKRWKDWWTRTLWTVIMITGFLGIISSGHIFVILMVVCIQTMVFKEVIAIAHVPSKEKKLPWFRLINWYFLWSANYYLYGETLLTHFKENVLVDAFLQPFATHHRFISFMFYVIGFVFFVMNLKKGHYKFQFLQFFWSHMTLLIVIVQSHFIINNILEGLIWFILPVSLVICNDIFAYICGFFMGRTRLIKLSPKKTWEGFVGGFICTLIFASIISRTFVSSPYLICPAKDLATSAWSDIQCDPNPVFIPVKFPFSPPAVSLLRHLLRREIKYISIAPIQFHAVVMAVFASIIAPFGGFFASGFKRAFKLKDFGDSIPGHGGLTDRMDCQFMMGLFSFMYYSSFIKVYANVSVASILQTAINGLAPQQQLELYTSLREYLVGQELLLLQA